MGPEESVAINLLLDQSTRYDSFVKLGKLRIIDYQQFLEKIMKIQTTLVTNGCALEFRFYGKSLHTKLEAEASFKHWFLKTYHVFDPVWHGINLNPHEIACNSFDENGNIMGDIDNPNLNHFNDSIAKLRKIVGTFDLREDGERKAE